MKSSGSLSAQSAAKHLQPSRNIEAPAVSYLSANRISRRCAYPGAGVDDDTNSGENFGRLLRRYRSAAGLTQEELAYRSGLSVRALSNMERGRTTRPFGRSVRLLADALQLDEAARAQLTSALLFADQKAGDDGQAAVDQSAAGLDGQRPPLEVPWQMPAPVAHFAGRAAELAALSGLLDQSRAGRTGTVVVSAIGGTAGVGKTALVTYWAHQVADSFPDGQLYVNLRGYDPAEPMAAADALAGFLRALGVPGHEIPAPEDECAARYRSLLAGRRILIVADNARSAEQVRPLLPGTSGCVIAVTSRDPLAGLVARDGARRLDLDLLSPDEAVGLLRALIGPRVDADRAAAAALAEQCSRLPLALRVASELAAANPDASIADLVSELADRQRRLDLLNADGDPHTAVRSVFSWSYRRLDTSTARAFRLLSLHPGPDFDRYSAAALTGRTVPGARDVLEVLARAYLIQPVGPARYGFHDLMRAYATGQAAALDSEEERRAALTRLFDYYVYTAAAAMNTLFPAERHRRPSVAPSACAFPPVADRAAARAWLDAERAGMTDVAVYAADDDWAGHATRLAAISFRYLISGGHYREATAINNHACGAARRMGNNAAEADALTNLGALDVQRARYRQAAGHLQQALELSLATGDQTGEARAQTSLGNIYLRQGDYDRAARCHQQVLVLEQALGDRTGEGRAYVNLGIVDMLQGRHQQAIRHYHQALAIRSETGDQRGEAYVRHNLGDAYLRQGRYHRAIGQFRRALTLFCQVGDRTGEVHALTSLGDAYRGEGRLREAFGHHQRALVLCREIRDRSGEAEALNGIGDTFIAAGEPDQARARHAAALALASETGEQDQLARAHSGLASVCHAIGDPGGASRHWREALALYVRLGAPEADLLRARLAAAGS